jgi:thiamine-phosphate pyrophosphorylase
MATVSYLHGCCCLQGIHYKERDRPQPPLPRVSPGLSQSTSLHSLQEVLQDWKNLDYAFLSPIFDSISKEGYSAAGFPPQELCSALQRAPMPVLALGGVDIDKVPVVRSMGFQGIGLLGAVWSSDDPLAALQAFLDSASET